LGCSSVFEPFSVSNGQEGVSTRHPELSDKCRCKRFIFSWTIRSRHHLIVSTEWKCLLQSSIKPRQEKLGRSTISQHGAVQRGTSQPFGKTISSGSGYMANRGTKHSAVMAVGRSCKKVWAPFWIPEAVEAIISIRSSLTFNR